MSFKRRIFFGSIWSLAGNGGQQLIGFLLFVYVARRLTPADVGLVALAMVFIDILSYASRFGQVETLQAHDDHDDRVLSASFWMLAVGGVLITGLIAFGAAASARYWDQTLFGTVLLLLSPITALRAWNAVPEAILKRRFEYRSLAVRVWLATMIGGVSGAYLAYRGFGVYALVTQRLVTELVGTITLWTVLGWRPRVSFDRCEAIRLFRSGTEIMAASFSGLINQYLVQGIIGFGLGATQLGFLRLGSRFFDFIAQLSVQPVSNVALSTFTQLQGDLEALKRAYLRLSQFMALASFPMFFGMGAVADIFVPVVLGAKWSSAIPVMQLLVFTRLPAPISYFFGPAMIAIDKTRVLLRQSIIQIVVTVILVCFGSFFGIVGVLLALIGRGVLLASYSIYTLNREIGLRPVAVLRTLLPPFAACLAMVAIVEFAKFELAGILGPLPLLIALVAVGVVSYGITLLLGDVIGFWRGYTQDAANSLGVRLPSRGRISTATSI